MVTPRRILCLSALLAVLLSASAGAAGEGSVPAAFWQEGTLYAFARLTEDPAGAEPRLQLGAADLTLPAEGPLARVSDAGTPVSYLLLVDRSNSMGGLSGNVTAFAKRLIREEAAFSLATFGVDFQLLDTGGGTGDELLAALDGVAYGEEGTDLPTAVVAAMDHLEARDRSPGELVNLVILVLYVLASRKLSSRDSNREDRAVRVHSWRTRAALIIYNTLMLVFILGPLVSVVVRSFVSTSSRYGEGFSVRSYQELFGLRRSVGMMSDASAALLNSLAIALIVAALACLFALFLSLFIARRNSRSVEVIGMFPLAISSVTLGLGYYIIKSHIHSSSLVMSYLLVILAHLVIALPFAMRTLLPAVRSQNLRVLDAAYTLGSGTAGTCFRIEIPQLKSAIAKAFIFSFALSMGEVNATLTLAEGRVVTLPMLLYRLINSYNYQGACTIGTVLIALTLVIFITAQALTHSSGRKAH